MVAVRPTDDVGQRRYTRNIASHQPWPNCRRPECTGEAANVGAPAISRSARSFSGAPRHQTSGIAKICGRAQRAASSRLPATHASARGIGQYPAGPKSEQPGTDVPGDSAAGPGAGGPRIAGRACDSGCPSKRVKLRLMICIGFPYLRARPRRNVELLLRTPAATAATRRGCGKGPEFFARPLAHPVHYTVRFSFTEPGKPALLTGKPGPFGGGEPNDRRRLPVP
jgi:hypothetical protein